MKKWLLFLPLVLLAFPARAEDKMKDDIQVSISENESGGHVLDGGFSIATSSSVAWEVLTDYDRMSDFVSSIKSSRRMKREKNHEVVEQVMSGKAGFFRKRIYLLLEVDEQLSQKIIFQDVSKKSFKTYNGSWEILPQDGQFQIQYHLEANPDFFSPDFIAEKAIQNTVKKLLTEVRTEIASRETQLKRQAEK